MGKKKQGGITYNSAKRHVEVDADLVRRGSGSAPGPNQGANLERPIDTTNRRGYVEPNETASRYFEAFQVPSLSMLF